LLFSFLLLFPHVGLCQTKITNNLELTTAEKVFLAEHTPIRIGIMNNWPPLNYVDENGKPAGIGVGYFEALNKKLGGSLVLEPAPFQENYEKVKNKQLDALMDITPKPDREAFFKFTKPYLAVPHVIVGRKEGPYFSSEKDLTAKTVALEKGYYNITYFRQNYPEVKIKEYNSTGDALDAVSRGEADAYAGNRAVAIYLIEKEIINNLQLQGRLGIPPSELTIGARNDWPMLVVILDKALRAISESEREAINAHYVKSRYEPWFASKQFWTVVLLSIGIVVLIGLLSLIWTRSLRRLVELKTKELTREISERKLANERLKASEEKYRTLFETANDAILLIRQDCFVDCNTRTLALFGCRREQIIGASFYKFSPPLQPDGRRSEEKALEKIKLALTDGPQYFEWEHCRLDGTSFAAEVNLSRLLLGDEVLLLAIVRDITERKLAAEREMELVKVRELDRMKSLFIASMSHELRTPLNSIIGFTGILVQGMAGELNDEQKKQLGMVKGSARHLLTLINDVIDVSKIEAEKIQLSIDEFNLSDTVINIKETFQTALEEKGDQLTLDIPEKLMIKSDERRIKQIVMNLVSNAIKFMGKGEITIRAGIKQDQVEVSVCDSGYGIQAENLPKLFKQFSRIFTDGQPQQEGTGLGLYLSQKLAKILGGVIKAESEFKKGSIFTVILPVEYKGGSE